MLLIFLDVFDEIMWKGAGGSNLECLGKLRIENAG